MAASGNGQIRDFGERKYKVLGTRPIRHDGVDKVTGSAVYGADIRLPGMLFGQVLRSPHAHARLRSIDTTRAMALPCVRAVVTGADLPAPPSAADTHPRGTGPARAVARGRLAMSGPACRATCNGGSRSWSARRPFTP